MIVLSDKAIQRLTQRPRLQAAGAMTALTAHMSDMEGMRYAMQAYRNSNGIDEPKAGGVA